MESVISDVTYIDLVIVGLAAFVAGSCSGMSGFGGGLLLPPVLAPILGVKAVVPVMSVAMLMSNAHRFWLYRRSVDLTLTLAALSTIVPGVILGTMIYVSLSGDAVAVVLGTVLLAAVPLGRYLAHRKIRLGAKGLAACGGPFGTLSGTTTGVGMLIVPILLGTGLAGPAFLATDAAISIAVNFTKAAMFSGSTLLTPERFLAGFLVGLCAIPGNYFARWILQRTSLRLHMRVIEALIVIGGISLLWGPLRDAFG